MMTCMDVGDEWIYRLRTYDSSERVKIICVERRKQTTRVDIEFLDGDKAGFHDNVPGNRLRARWSEVAAYDELMANWQRLSGSDLDETEESAVGEVFDALIAKDVATYYDSFVRDGTTVRDREGLERLMQRPLSDVLDQVEWFEHDNALELSVDGTLLIAHTSAQRTLRQSSNGSWRKKPKGVSTANVVASTTPSTAQASGPPRRNGSTSVTASATVRSTNYSVAGAVTGQSRSMSG